MRNSDLCVEFVNNVANINGKKGNNISISWDGTRLYSYGTCIGERLSDGSFILNVTKYSVTTSKHQSYLRRALVGRKVVETSKIVPIYTQYLTRYTD